MAAAPTRDEAWALIEDWIESDSLRKHLLGVEACMRAYARRVGRGRGALGRRPGCCTTSTTSAIPDLDTGHPRKALELFRELDYPQELIDAVAGHADFLEVPRETRMAKTLYAVDELSGFVSACALVRPTGIEGMTPKSVKKKLKQPSFAAGVNRDDVRRGAEELGVDFDQHVAFVIAAMEARKDELGLAAGDTAASSASARLLPAAAGLGPGLEVIDRAEGVGNAVLAAMAHEHEADVGQRRVAVSAAVDRVRQPRAAPRSPPPPSAGLGSTTARRARAGRTRPGGRPAAPAGASRPRARSRCRTRCSSR